MFEEVSRVKVQVKRELSVVLKRNRSDIRDIL